MNDEQENPVQWLEDEGDMILIPRGLVGAACSALDRQQPADKVMAALRYYTMNERKDFPPVAEVDMGDDGYFANILPDCSVSIGDKLYPFPPLSRSPRDWEKSFRQWWDAHGAYLRAGGGQYEETFGYHAWEAAAVLYTNAEVPAKVYMAHNRTSSLLFASKADAEEYAAWNGGPTAGIHVTECVVTGVTPDRAYPLWNKANSHGLDMGYFRRKLENILQGLNCYTPEEFARTMATHSRTADSSVIEKEFAPAVPAVPEEWRQTVQAYMDSYEVAWKETIAKLFNRGITEIPLSDYEVDHLNKLQSLRDLLTNRRSASNG